MLPRIFLLCLTFLFASSAAVMAANPVDDAHPSAEADGGGDAHGEHGGKAGPPLDFKADLALWSLITFVVFVFVLGKFAWKPLIEGLDTREANLRQQAAETQAALAKAESLLKDHETKLAATQDEVKEIIAEARRDAERTGQDIVAEAQKEADATRARAVEEVGRAKDIAVKELFDVMSGQVAGATEHVLGRSLNDSDQDRLIDEALKQVANS